MLIHLSYYFFYSTFQMIPSLADSFHAGLSIPDDSTFKVSSTEKETLRFRSSTKDVNYIIYIYIYIHIYVHTQVLHILTFGLLQT